jgi:hypothetical protein
VLVASLVTIDEFITKLARQDDNQLHPAGCLSDRGLIECSDRWGLGRGANSRVGPIEFDSICCGRNSVVECQLPKLDVRSSNLLARSYSERYRALWAHVFRWRRQPPNLIRPLLTVTIARRRLNEQTRRRRSYRS